MHFVAATCQSLCGMWPHSTCVCTCTLWKHICGLSHVLFELQQAAIVRNLSPCAPSYAEGVKCVWCVCAAPSLHGTTCLIDWDDICGLQGLVELLHGSHHLPVVYLMYFCLEWCQLLLWGLRTQICTDSRSSLKALEEEAVMLWLSQFLLISVSHAQWLQHVQYLQSVLKISVNNGGLWPKCLRNDGLCCTLGALIITHGNGERDGAWYVVLGDLRMLVHLQSVSTELLIFTCHLGSLELSPLRLSALMPVYLPSQYWSNVLTVIQYITWTVLQYWNICWYMHDWEYGSHSTHPHIVVSTGLAVQTPELCLLVKFPCTTIVSIKLLFPFSHNWSQAGECKRLTVYMHMTADLAYRTEIAQRALHRSSHLIALLLCRAWSSSLRLVVTRGVCEKHL